MDDQTMMESGAGAGGDRSVWWTQRADPNVILLWYFPSLSAGKQLGGLM